MIATQTAPQNIQSTRRESRIGRALGNRSGLLALLVVAEAVAFALLSQAISLPEPLAIGARLLLSF